VAPRITRCADSTLTADYVGGMPVPRAQLKVFSPLDAFPPPERERWRSYVEDGRGLTRREVVAAESGATVTRLVTGRSRLGPEAAIVRRMGKRTLICPLQLELRAAVALASFRRAVPPTAFEAFVPFGSTLGRLEQLASSGRAPHVLDEPFAVPLHWFVAFAPRERRFTDPPEGSGARLVYLTSVDRAQDRLERALDVVESTVEDGEDVLAALADVAAWLDAFEPTSLLELDYGGVAGTVPTDVLRDDHTCEELWTAIDALAAGDLLGAAAAYGVARARWTDHRARQHAS
jgi:hypothetical protein